MTTILDPIDLKILRILLRDGRTPYSVIAKETRLSDVAVKKRVEKLISRGIIRQVAAIVDRKKLGYRYTFFIHLKVDPSEVYLVYKRLASMPNILEVYILAGDYPILAKGVSEDIDDLKHFISEIGKLDGVVDIKTAVALEETEKTITVPSKIGQRVLE